MSKLTHLKEHIHALDDIKNIMKAMKNHALIEINKMTRYISTNEKSRDTIKEVGCDFFSAYPSYLPLPENTTSIICILIGSERGFCGNFNEVIISKLNDFEKSQPETSLSVVVVGRKLAMRMADDARVVRKLDGYETAEDIQVVILDLIRALEDVSFTIKVKPHPVSWRFFFNEGSYASPQTNILQPIKEFFTIEKPTSSFPPLLYLPLENFLFDFIEQYLLATLNFIFFQSFVTENYQRLHHLDNAIERIEKNVARLAQNLNLLRQEEITQEIEVILLSVEAITDEVRHKYKL